MQFYIYKITENDPETSIAATAVRESLDSGDLRKAEDAARVFVRLMESRCKSSAR